MLLLKSLLDPCAYLLPYGCPLLVSSLAGQLEAAFAEEEIEEDGFLGLPALETLRALSLGLLSIFLVTLFSLLFFQTHEGKKASPVTFEGAVG